MQKLTDQEIESIADDVAPTVDKFHRIMKDLGAVTPIEFEGYTTKDSIKDLLRYLFEDEDTTSTGTGRVQVEKDFDEDRVIGVRISYDLGHVWADRGLDR